VKAQEKFLVLEITPARTRGWFLGVDADRNIKFEKTLNDIDLKKFFAFTKAPLRNMEQSSWEGERVFKSRRQVIVAADPRLATTIPVPLDLAREEGNNKKSKLTLAEAENMIAQAEQKIFNGCRAEAARRFGIHELDAILVAAKAKHFKVDGEAVKTPAGHTGKTMSLLLELTFTTRDVFETLQQFFNSPDEFFFVEAPQAHLAAFSRIRKLPLNLIVANDDVTALYVLENAKGEHPVLYRETIGWLFGSFFKTIKETLAVSDATARDLYRLYRKGETSDDIKRAFKKLLQPVQDELLAAVEKAKVNGVVYMNTEHALPFETPHRHGTATFEAYPTEELMHELGFSIGNAKTLKSSMGGESAALRAMLYFLEAYFDKSGSTEINQKLRRRLHWLKV
jgi:hypothetical protein